MNENRIDSKNEKCQNCGGNLKFNPSGQNLICENCKSNFTIVSESKIAYHDLSNHKKESSSAEYEQYANQNKKFKCPNCGANVVLSKLEISQNCPYCDTALVASTNESIGLKPDSIIPFMFDEKEASEKFASTVKKRFFAPRKFKKKLPENQIKGIYFPAFGFDTSSHSVYNGQLYTEHTETDSDGHSHTERDYFRIRGTLNRDYKDIIVECSSKITQSELNGFLPYNYQQKKAFTNSFILGYSVEQYDKQVADCISIYKSELDAIIRSDILSQYHYDGVSYLNVQTDCQNEKYLYHILPVYKFEYDYKNKKYITYMNGQTGKVDGNTPKSGWKIALVIVLPILIFMAIVILSFLGNK